ncbi:unnamed protein product [Discosporangium mesarthrocarpum]
MVGSKRCHLPRLSPAQLVQGREEAGEMGGYFIVRGIERVVRLLQVPVLVVVDLGVKWTVTLACLP